MSTFKPQLGVLPAAQQKLWPQLRTVPRHFVLYGGTALALRLGHRQSLDFDFFSAASFQPEQLHRHLSFAAASEVIRKYENTVSLRTEKPFEVHLSFFGGLTFGQVEPPQMCVDNGVYVASLKDLFATKLNTVYQRAEAKDYLDVDALINSGCPLATGLGCAQAIYRNAFNPMLPLKALTYFEDGDLASLPAEVQLRLRQAVEAVDQIPTVRLDSEHISVPESLTSEGL